MGNVKVIDPSLNTYGFSKLWHKCGVVDLRAGDVRQINSLAKSWLYADLLEKPEELALWRSTQKGGLGLFNVEIRAKSYLINTFLETSCKPKFRHSLYHELLYKQEVNLQDSGPFKLVVPPYFSGDFFPAIRRMKLVNLCPPGLTLKSVYTFLMEEITTVEVNNEKIPKPLKAEIAAPLIPWNDIWMKVR